MDMGPPLCNPMLLHEIGKGKARLVLEASAALCSKLLDHEWPPVFAHGVAVCHAGDIAGYLVSCHRSSVGLRWPSQRIAALHRFSLRSVLAARRAFRRPPVAPVGCANPTTCARESDPSALAGWCRRPRFGRGAAAGGGWVIKAETPATMEQFSAFRLHPYAFILRSRCRPCAARSEERRVGK